MYCTGGKTKRLIYEPTIPPRTFFMISSTKSSIPLVKVSANSQEYPTMFSDCLLSLAAGLISTYCRARRTTHSATLTETKALHL
ncbi:hypothetical protein NPIL_304051 [Nephila pilipes]|uniref:Uncharacterized protein n=1 Tax=Nephila pilipes TaxID=299642 RepID=A0A8X6NRZ3_NEPPI|nr:hypothetical protein NPIL_304051 [Nephila pilipes]